MQMPKESAPSLISQGAKMLESAHCSNRGFSAPPEPRHLTPVSPGKYELSPTLLVEEGAAESNLASCNLPNSFSATS